MHSWFSYLKLALTNQIKNVATIKSLLCNNNILIEDAAYNSYKLKIGDLISNFNNINKWIY